MNTTQSGAIGVNRTQYMSSMVPAQALEQEAGQQYGDILKQAKARNLLDRDPAQVARARTISQRLIAQAGVFRPMRRAGNGKCTCCPATRSTPGACRAARSPSTRDC